MEVIEGEVKSEGIKKALIALLCSGVISGGFFVCLFVFRFTQLSSQSNNFYETQNQSTNHSPTWRSSLALFFRVTLGLEHCLYSLTYIVSLA